MTPVQGSFDYQKVKNRRLRTTSIDYIYNFMGLTTESPLQHL